MKVDFGEIFKERIAASSQIGESKKKEDNGGEKREAKIQAIPSRIIAVKIEEAPELKEATIDQQVAFFATGTVRGIKEDESGKRYLIEIDSTNFLKKDQIAGA